VRDVTLDVGIPDLSSGRRPVVPPLARLRGVDGVVSVRFSIDGAGDAQVQAVEGPEILQAAARSMVASWRFQRASRERVFAIAEVLYHGDVASARVHRAD
jgi:outer membrane biosynthesis protein TonB